MIRHAVILHDFTPNLHFHEFYEALGPPLLMRVVSLRDFGSAEILTLKSVN